MLREESKLVRFHANPLLSLRQKGPILSAPPVAHEMSKYHLFPENHPHATHEHIGDRGFVQYLIAVDGSDASRRAAAYVKRILRAGDRIVYMTVVKDDGQVEQADHMLASYHQSVHEGEIEVVRRVMVRNNHDAPGHLIAKYALEVGADILVTGRRGLGEKKRLFEGGVSKYLAQHAHCSLIIIK